MQISDGTTTATASERIERTIGGCGVLSGISSGNVHIFRGVPYAAAPIGDMRFSPPARRPPWSGTLDATRDRPMAPQTGSRGLQALGPIAGEMSEDCLNLTIWAPANARGAPVLLWIHGGAFMTGAGSQSWYDGERLARELGVVVVTCNYRLGAAGYLSIPGLIEGNFGLRDQIMALRWVHEHISDLGGDPTNVTLFGESAGSHAIASMLCIPETDGLFAKAILQSAPLGITLLPAPEARRRATAFVEALGLSIDDHDLLSKLRMVPIQALLDAQSATAIAMQDVSRADVTPAFVPADAAPFDLGDIDLCEYAAVEAARRGVDVIIGWTRDEGALFMGQHPLRQTLDDFTLGRLYVGILGHDAERRLDEARQRRSGATLGDLLDELVTEAVFRDPSLRFAKRMAENGGRVFVYRFDWESPAPSLRACHCADLPFTFGNFDAWDGTLLMQGVDRAEVEPLMREMMSRWADFARTGDAGMSPWSQNRHPVLHLDSTPRVEDISNLVLL